MLDAMLAPGEEALQATGDRDLFADLVLADRDWSGLPEPRWQGYFSQMKEARISQVKNQLSRYLALVRKGEVVRILDRDRPVAQIVPIGQASEGRPAGTEALAEMERKGLIRRGTGRVDREILDRDPPGQPAGVLDALLQERETR